MRKNFKGRVLVAIKVGVVEIDNRRYNFYRPERTFTGITRCEPLAGGKTVFMFDNEFFKRFHHVRLGVWEEYPY